MLGDGQEVEKTEQDRRMTPPADRVGDGAGMLGIDADGVQDRDEQSAEKRSHL